MSSSERRAVFLDRDGTLMVDTSYPKDPDEVRLLPHAVAALHRLQQAQFHLVVVSNQSGVGRGLITPSQALAVHDRFINRFAEQGIHLKGVYYCPHAPEAGCECRKPAPGMILQAAHELNLDLARSFMVGDKPSDVEAGLRAGCRSLLLTRDSSWSDLLTVILP
jgi:histidinol-phosphate phosphatase family protein